MPTQEWKRRDGRAERTDGVRMPESCLEGGKIVPHVDTDFERKLHQGFLRGQGELGEAENEGFGGDGREIGDEGSRKGTFTERRQA